MTHTQYMAEILHIAHDVDRLTEPQTIHLSLCRCNWFCDAGGYNYEYTRHGGTSPLARPPARRQIIPADLAFPIGIGATLAISLLMLLAAIARRLRVRPPAPRADFALLTKGAAACLIASEKISITEIQTVERFACLEGAAEGRWKVP